MTLTPAITVTAGCSQELPCNFSATAAFCRDSRAFLERAGLAGAEIDGWELVLAEGLNNAVKHCAPESRTLPVRVDLLVTSAWVEARITDHTPGFELPERAELPPDDSESGRGLFLIQHFTDQCTYLRGTGENCLVLRRTRDRTNADVVPPENPGESLAEIQRTLDLMTEELASAYESLSAIFRFSSELHGDLASGELLDRWTTRLLDITEADWLVLRLAVPSDGSLRLASMATREKPSAALIPEIPLFAADAIETRAVSTRNDVWFDATTRLSSHDPLGGLAGDGCGFSHALFANEDLVGVITLGRRDPNRPFAAGQVSVIHTFGDFLGLQIRSARMQEEQVRARLNVRDLEIAAHLQRSLLPAEMPSLPGVSLAGFYRSARQIGGDYYDALPAGDGCVLLAVADVMGKGLPAALFAFVFHSLVRARRDLAARPGELLEWLNEHLYDELDRAEMFITAQLAFLDCRSGQIRVASAGHPPFLVADSRGEVCEITDGGLPLGVMQCVSFPEACREWPAGVALMFTDGLIEARNAAGATLGMEPVKNTLAAAARRGESPGATQARLAQQLREFEGDAAPADDTAFLVITRTPAH